MADRQSWGYGFVVQNETTGNYGLHINKNGTFIARAYAPLGAENIFLNGHTSIKGANTLSTSSALQIYDGDGTPNLLVNFKNNGTVNMSSLPTSSSGLVSGDIYNDSGTLKIV